MPSRKPALPDIPDDDAGMSTPTNTDADDSLALAEAEAREAETTAAAARAKAEVLRLRRDAEKAKTEAEAADTEDDSEDHVEDRTGDGAETDADEETVAVRSGRLGRVLPWTAAVVTVLIIGALIATGTWIVIQHRGVQAHQQRTSEFEAAARQGVVTLMSLDYNKVDDNVKAIVDNSTGEFKKDFESAADDFKKTARDSKAVTEAMVSSAAVETSTDSDAVVLVAATTKVTNAAGARQDPRNWRLSVNLVREGDQIKLSKVEFVP
ncbi:VirB8/TrbF family protein [Mycobacterium sp. BMJ-28]